VTRTIIDGSFKVPQLRNVALTPPYFHNGGFATLRQMLEFYRRAGNRRDASLTEPGAAGDDSGTGCNGEGQIPVTGPKTTDHDQELRGQYATRTALGDRRACDAERPRTPDDVGDRSPSERQRRIAWASGRPGRPVAASRKSD
jgi:hypothetical protein